MTLAVDQTNNRRCREKYPASASRPFALVRRAGALAATEPKRAATSPMPSRRRPAAYDVSRCPITVALTTPYLAASRRRQGENIENPVLWTNARESYVGFAYNKKF
jgi:hypothetical protein